MDSFGPGAYWHKSHLAGAGLYGAKLRKGLLFCKKEAKNFCKLAFLVPLSTQAPAADVNVTINNVRNNKGHVLVAICPQAQFLQPHCPWQASTPAHPGDVHLTIHGVPPGRYAAQAFHDEDDNQTLERSFFGLPEEGMGFSNNAPMHFGPPSFNTASFPVSGAGAAIGFSLKYY